MKGSVSVGDTVFVKMVFSEPMKHIVADDASARPILYYRRVEEGEKLVRFRMVAHGAGGEDFVSGDAKPLQSSTDDYICKYTVVPEDEGKQISFMIGRFSVDLEGVPLPEFYRHKVKLQVDSAAPVKVEDPEPLPLEPLTIVSITHYRDDNDEMISEGASVDAGTTITTEIVFSAPVRANSVVISYPKGHSTERLYHSTGVHWRKSYQISRDGTTVRSKLVASEETFSLTVERAASLEGNVLKQAVIAPEIPVVPRMEPVVVESEEPTVVRPADAEPREPTVVRPADVGSGGFTNAEIEEYRALHAMVYRVDELRGNTKDPNLFGRPDLFWHFVTGTEITIHEFVRLDVIYRNQYPGATEEQRIGMGIAKYMEYLKIKLAHPNSAAEETLDLYTKSVKNGTVNRIRSELLDDKWGVFFIK